jgi:hypothetical protein
MGYLREMPGRTAALLVVATGLGVGLGLAGCTHSKPARNLDLDAIRVSPDARLRTDTVGDGPFASNASFVLVDAENTAAARIKVKGALIPDDPPRAHISDLHSFDDHGKVVVQAYLVNAADRPGQIMAIGSFHDAHGQPMTRPFQLLEVPARDRRVVQFVGPEGSTRGTIFVGDTVY